MEQFDHITATVHLRSGGEFIPRIHRLKLNGWRGMFTVLFPIEEGLYEGEWAVSPTVYQGPGTPWEGVPWIASGDLRGIVELD
jgi:hypothetical protein